MRERERGGEHLLLVEIERERERERACVCVCEREREREKEDGRTFSLSVVARFSSASISFLSSKRCVLEREQNREIYIERE